MTVPYIDTHLKRLAVAREAAQLGARTRTVVELSCLPYQEVLRLFFDGRRAVHGKAPHGHNWVSDAPLICRVESAIFCNLFERLRVAGHGSSVSMVVAYREFARTYQPMLHERARIERRLSEATLTFDRAFQLASHLCVSCPSDRALWLRPQPTYTLTTCPECRTRSVKAFDRIFKCPMCQLIQRRNDDRRVKRRMSSAADHRGTFTAVASFRAFADLLSLPISRLSN